MIVAVVVVEVVAEAVVAAITSSPFGNYVKVLIWSLMFIKFFL